MKVGVLFMNHDPETKRQIAEWVGKKSPRSVSKIKGENNVGCFFRL